MRLLLIVLVTGLLCMVWVPAIAQKRNITSILGTEPLDSVTSMSKTEVTVHEWVTFIINNDFDLTLFPDKTVLSVAMKLFFEDLEKKAVLKYIKVINNNSALKKTWGTKGIRITSQFRELIDTDTMYFSMKSPMVGISYAQAMRFCAWREALLHESGLLQLLVSLPSEGWYQKVNVNKDSLCKPELKCDPCERYQFNYAHTACTSTKKNKEMSTQGEGLLRVDSYWPSILGLYNIQGNAAEMTATEGVACGGSFRHYAIESYKDKVQTYTKPEAWLGFRCLITIK